MSFREVERRPEDVRTANELAGGLAPTVTPTGLLPRVGLMRADRFAVPAWWHPYSPTVTVLPLNVRGLWVTIGAYCAHLDRDAISRAELLRLIPEEPSRTGRYLSELIRHGLAEVVDGDMVRLVAADPLLAVRRTIEEDA